MTVVRPGQSNCGFATTFENHACVPCGENMSFIKGFANSRNPSRERRAFTGAPQPRITRLANRKKLRVTPGPSANSEVRNGAPEIAGGSCAEMKSDGCSATEIHGFFRYSAAVGVANAMGCPTIRSASRAASSVSSKLCSIQGIISFRKTYSVPLRG